MNRQTPVRPPYSDHETPSRSTTPGFSGEDMGEYDGAFPGDQVSNMGVTRTATLASLGHFSIAIADNFLPFPSIQASGEPAASASFMSSMNRAASLGPVAASSCLKNT